MFGGRDRLVKVSRKAKRMETYTSPVDYLVVPCSLLRSCAKIRLCVPQKEEAPKQDPIPRSDEKVQKDTGCKWGAWALDRLFKKW